MAQFGTVIMGRKTYEFGFQYCLEPGQPAYPNIEHFIFSNTLKINELADQVLIEKPTIERVKEIKSNAQTDIYLCGGGEFAGWLLDHGLIDQLKLKLNPIILGDGIRLFGKSNLFYTWKHIETESFEDGLQILSYEQLG